MKFTIKDFFGKCDQIRCFRQVWSHLLEKSLMKTFITCTVKSGMRFLEPGIEIMTDISTSNTRIPADTGPRSRIDLETRHIPFKIT